MELIGSQRHKNRLQTFPYFSRSPQSKPQARAVYWRSIITKLDATCINICQLFPKRHHMTMTGGFRAAAKTPMLLNQAMTSCVPKRGLGEAKRRKWQWQQLEMRGHGSTPKHWLNSSLRRHYLQKRNLPQKGRIIWDHGTTKQKRVIMHQSFIIDTSKRSADTWGHGEQMAVDLSIECPVVLCHRARFYLVAILRFNDMPGSNIKIY